jgi:hypothetical protein
MVSNHQVRRHGHWQLTLRACSFPITQISEKRSEAEREGRKRERLEKEVRSRCTARAFGADMGW